jgi:hypothetical protein
MRSNLISLEQEAGLGKERSVHKFTVGQLVNLAPHDLQASNTGSYVIIRLVADNGANPRYRIKNNAENYDRVVQESELSLASDADGARAGVKNHVSQA